MSFKQSLIISCILLIAVSISAEVPNVINNQGRLTNAAGEPVADGSYLVKFIIYDAPTSGTELWNSSFQTINTVDGLFSYQLGSNVNLPDGLFSDTSIYLGITFGTNPEISPRTRFISTSYAFQAKNANIASDANSLGGSQPSFYLDWNNLTNVPADIADGDDGGISQGDADAFYVNVTGDDMTGNLNAKDGSNITRVEVSGVDYGVKGFDMNGDLISRLWGNAYGELNLYDNLANETVSLNANTSGSGASLLLIDPNGANDVEFFANSTGNNTVRLPVDAIDDTEIIDEPGLASGTGTSHTLTTTMQDLATISITIPTSGYIYVVGRCWCASTGSTGNTDGVFQIDETSGGSFTNPYYTVAGPSSAQNSSFRTVNSVFVDRVYFKSAGTYTFRFEGEKESETSSVSTGNNRVTAMFFPTAYGAVSSVSPLPPTDADAELVTSTDHLGATQQGYKYDLRDLELRAKNAEIKALEAKQALEDALSDNKQ